MMKQIFQIIPGGTQFELQNAGFGTCAVGYQGAVVMIGGCCPTHGKVDRWEINSIIYIIPHFSLRYDSEGNYLDSLPDLLEARWLHACTTFTSSNGERVC